MHHIAGMLVELLFITKTTHILFIYITRSLCHTPSNFILFFERQKYNLTGISTKSKYYITIEPTAT